MDRQGWRSVDRAGDTIDGGRGGRAKGKSTYPPRLCRYQQRGNKGETGVIRHGQGVLLLILRPLSQETNMTTPLMS